MMIKICQEEKVPILPRMLAVDKSRISHQLWHLLDSLHDSLEVPLFLFIPGKWGMTKLEDSGCQNVTQ